MEQFTGSVSAVDMLISLVVAFIIGMFIIYIYRKKHIQELFIQKAFFIMYINACDGNSNDYKNN
ncbi:MAG: hypothetical protein L6V81_08900 [Clostridium sp.]|nr:MAG: hypothetical protein L6V81_08900 [Clostridium sp.]